MKFTIKPSVLDKKKIIIPIPEGIFGLLIFMLIGLKITHQIEMSWPLILSPIILGTLIELYCKIRNKI